MKIAFAAASMVALAGMAEAVTYSATFTCDTSGPNGGADDNQKFSGRVEVSEDDVTFHITAPQGLVWMGLGFGSGTKNGANYAIIYKQAQEGDDPKGTLEERFNLGKTPATIESYYGTLIAPANPPTTVVTSSDLDNGVLNVIMRRPLNAPTGPSFTFTNGPETVDFFCAYGNTRAVSGNNGIVQEKHTGQAQDMKLQFVDERLATSAPTPPTIPPPPPVPFDGTRGQSSTLQVGIAAILGLVVAML